MKRVFDIIESEPEYPDPCPELRKLIRQAVQSGDEDHVLHMVRQAVRQTKQSIIARLTTELGSP